MAKLLKNIHYSSKMATRKLQGNSDHLEERYFPDLQRCFWKQY